MIVFESETHGLVRDHFVEGVREEDQQLLEELEEDGRIEATQSSIHGKVLHFTTVDGEDRQITFDTITKGWGGNTFNTAVAKQKIQDALGEKDPHHPHLLYSTHIINDRLRDVFREHFRRNSTLESHEPKPIARQGFYIPKRTSPSDGTYISQTPEYEYTNTQIPRNRWDFFFSSLHPESSLIEQLEERARISPNTRIYVAPGKQQLKEGFPPEFLEQIHLQAMNVKEAKKLLGASVPKNLDGEALVKELSRQLAELGPKHILLTNGALPVAHYDREHDKHTIVELPHTEDIRRLAFDLHGQHLPENDISRIGGGDALLGTFIALEVLRENRGKNITLEQSLQLAVIVSRYHTFSKQSNIGYMDEEFLRKLTGKIMPKLIGM